MANDGDTPRGIRRNFDKPLPRQPQLLRFWRLTFSLPDYRLLILFSFKV
jgi:hypothetical protein